MSLPSDRPAVGQDGSYWQFPDARSSSYLVVGFMMLGMAIYRWISSNSSIKAIPCINPVGFLSGAKVRRDFWEFGEETLNRARQNFHGGIPGFGPFDMVGRGIVAALTRKYLTKVSAYMTKVKSDEAEFALSKAVRDSSAWHEIALAPFTVDISARMALRIFVGEELCRDEDWLRITEQYELSWIPTSSRLHEVAWPFRRIFHWFIPECKELRDIMKEARRLLAPTIDKRRTRNQAAAAAGREVPRYNDAIEWFEEEAKLRGWGYDVSLAADVQMILGITSIHTTSDLMEQFMIDLGQHPDVLQPIREEVIHHLQLGGISKASLYNMKLLDSALKETQRRKPMETVALRRRAQEDIKLPNGLTLKTGTRTLVDTYRMHDPAIYENPDEWDPARFLNLRSKPGGESTAQLVSPSINHIGFGYGKHSCPGRFFATDTLKVALCHLLVKYEWKLAPGTDTTPQIRGILHLPNPTVKILIRRREKIEVDFDSIWDKSFDTSVDAGTKM
ncbi:cytochrome P450 [Hypomontagnella monticulosa]|nr:cytochrome P450 [Hypomontagnella monticulosa]